MFSLFFVPINFFVSNNKSLIEYAKHLIYLYLKEKKKNDLKNKKKHIINVNIKKKLKKKIKPIK
jgi:hypothetical protein